MGQATYAATQWAIIVGLARLGSTHFVGIFSLALAISAPVFMLASLQLNSLHATDAQSAFSNEHYQAVRSLSSAAAFIVCATIGVLYGGLEAQVIIYVAAAKSAEALSDVPFAVLQRQGKLRRLAFAQIGKGILSTGALLSTIYLTGSLAYACLAMAAARFLSLLAIDLPIAGLAPQSIVNHAIFDGASFRLLRLAIPLGYAALLQSLQANLPRYIIEDELGASELGVFAALAYTFAAGSTVVQAIGRAVAPRFARLLAAHAYSAFRSLIRRILLVGALVSGIAIGVSSLFGEEILLIFYGKEYSEHANAFTILAVGACFGYLAALMRQGLTAGRILRGQLYVLIISAVSTGFLALVLTRPLGLIGAATAVTIGGFIQLLGNHVLLGMVRAAVVTATVESTT